jgi:GMP synthase-like glutamine amidotransferase
MRPVAVFRFSPTEGPAWFAEWLTARGVAWELIALDEGAGVPPAAGAYSGIGLMGGPMSVNDDLRWRAPLLGLLRAAVGAGIPVIGHCLGGQLLAQALGAPVTPAPRPEIGWHGVETLDVSARVTWFAGRAAFTSFQWHYDTFALPPGAVRVLTNAHVAEQGFIVDDRHIGLQGHIEMTPGLVLDWLASGAAELPEATQPGIQSAADIRRDLPVQIDALHGVAADVYARWARGLRG